MEVLGWELGGWGSPAHRKNRPLPHRSGPASDFFLLNSSSNIYCVVQQLLRRAYIRTATANHIHQTATANCIHLYSYCVVRTSVQLLRLHTSVHLLLTAYISTSTASCMDQDNYNYLLPVAFISTSTACYIHQYIYCHVHSSVQLRAEVPRNSRKYQNLLRRERISR
jgi:hypothetical protein